MCEKDTFKMTFDEFLFFTKKNEKKFMMQIDKEKEEIKNMVWLLKDVMSNNFGVSCFSSKCDDILMWSHYADNHFGL